MAESFLSTLEAELLSRRRFASQAEAKVAYFSYIEAGTMPRDCIPASHTARPLPMKPTCIPPRACHRLSQSQVAARQRTPRKDVAVFS
jgi:hypothetical protein